MGEGRIYVCVVKMCLKRGCLFLCGKGRSQEVKILENGGAKENPCSGVQHTAGDRNGHQSTDSINLLIVTGHKSPYPEGDTLCVAPMKSRLMSLRLN